MVDAPRTSAPPYGTMSTAPRTRSSTLTGSPSSSLAPAPLTRTCCVAGKTTVPALVAVGVSTVTRALRWWVVMSGAAWTTSSGAPFGPPLRSRPQAATASDRATRPVTHATGCLTDLEMPAPLPALVSHYFAGLFVGNFLPSTVGGDVLRVTRLSAANGNAPDTFASVVLERLTGWIVLPVLTLAGLAVNPHLLHLKGAATHVAVLVSVTTLALLAAVLFLASHPAVGRRLADNEGWLRFIRAVHVGLDRVKRDPVAAAQVLAAGFVYQLAVVLAAFLAGRALQLGVGWTTMLAFMPAVAILQVLPITIGGLGVREGAFGLLLGRRGL